MSLIVEETDAAETPCPSGCSEEALLNGSMRRFPLLSQTQDFSIGLGFFGNSLLGMRNPLSDLGSIGEQP